jgi:DNA-binding MarR family transcriptional regulator
MIDRLEEKGFIRRVRSQEDRRVVHLEMTEAGKALYPQVIPPVVDLLNAHLQGFSQEELDMLIGFLKRIVANNESSFSAS